MSKSSLILLLCCPFLLFAQEKDFQLWSKLGASYDFNKKVSFSVDQAYRMRENASLSDVAFTNFSVKHDLVKKWSTAVGYRYINDFDFYQNSSVRHRIYVDLNFRKKQKRWLFKNRIRYQYQEENHTIRDKVSISYNVRKTPLKPFTAFELFYRESEFKKWRYTLGASYPLSKSLDFDAYYRIQQALNSNNPKQLYILGLGLDYKF